MFNQVSSLVQPFISHPVPRQVDMCIAVLQLAVVLKEHLMDYLLPPQGLLLSCLKRRRGSVAVTFKYGYS
jgi:hypothetical protein